MRSKSKMKLAIFCLPLMMASCNDANHVLDAFDFLPIENLSISFDEGSNMEYGIANIQEIKTHDEFLNLPNEYSIDQQNISNYDNYFFEKYDLYLIAIQISGNLLAGISIGYGFAICHIFQLEIINEKLNNYAFAFSYEKDVNITNVETDFINVTSKEYDGLKKIYDGKIWEGIS